MKHRIFGRKLGRDINSRKALLNNLASSVLAEGKITTTLAKAKFAKPFIDKLITDAKKGALHRKRIISSILTVTAFAKLTNEIAAGFAIRKSGYTRIMKLGQRRGDNAPMARLELLELDQKGITKSKGKRSQRKSAVTPPKSKNEKH